MTAAPLKGDRGGIPRYVIRFHPAFFVSISFHIISCECNTQFINILRQFCIECMTTMVIFVDMKLCCLAVMATCDSVMRDMMSRAWFWNISPFGLAWYWVYRLCLIRCRCVFGILTYSDVWLQIAGILYSARASAGLISRTIPIALEGG